MLRRWIDKCVSKDIDDLIENSYKETVFHRFPYGFVDEVKGAFKDMGYVDAYQRKVRPVKEDWKKLNGRPVKFQSLDPYSDGHMHLWVWTGNEDASKILREGIEYSFLNGQGFYVGFGVPDGAKLDLSLQVVYLPDEGNFLDSAYHMMQKALQ